MSTNRKLPPPLIRRCVEVRLRAVIDLHAVSDEAACRGAIETVRAMVREGYGEFQARIAADMSGRVQPAWIKENFGQVCFDCLDLSRAVVLHELDLIDESKLFVIGDPANGCYEWVIHWKNRSIEFSNLGWGDPISALRAGLNFEKDHG